MRQDDGTLSERGGAYLQLQQQGKSITGSVGPSSSNAHPVEKASFTLGELKFSTHYLDPDSKETVNWSFDLTVDGDPCTARELAAGETTLGSWKSS